MIFESELYWKSDAIDDSDEIGITLNEDFEILQNKIVGSVGYFQTTELLISPADKVNIFEKIKNSINYKIVEQRETLADSMNRELSEKVIWNYQFNALFVSESYFKEAGYVPIEISVTLKKESDTLELTKIMN